jgi:hypothetical protein
MSSNPTDISQEEKERIFIGSRTPLNDEQFYFGVFGVLFLFVSSWALSSNFKPIDTVIVLLVFGIILILLVGFRYMQRYAIIKDNLVSHFKKEDIFTNDVPVDPKAGFFARAASYIRIFFYSLFDVRIKPWNQFEKLISTTMGPNNWNNLKNMIDWDDWANNAGYTVCTMAGAIAVLGTILRLHGTRGLSNTSGIVLVVLYEIVFTLYCSWQMLFKQQRDALQECMNTLPREDTLSQYDRNSYNNYNSNNSSYGYNNNSFYGTQLNASSTFFQHQLS